VLWLILIGCFLGGVYVGRWALVGFVPLATWIQTGPRKTGLELWITAVLAAGLAAGLGVRRLVRRLRPA
jgi:hypothetical protein